MQRKINIAFCTIIALVACVSIAMHLQLGFSPFARGVVGHHGGFLGEIFDYGSVPDAKWWHGVGFTFLFLVRYPTVVYIILVSYVCGARALRRIVYKNEKGT